MKLRTVISLVVFAVVSLVASFALAETCPDVNLNVSQEAQQEWWMVLLDALLQAVAPIAIAVLTTLSSIAIRKWGAKLDEDKRVAFQKLAQGIVTGGITFAEEQARKALRAGNPQTPGAEKLQMAVDYAQEQFASSGITNIATEELTKLIESRLHAERVKPDGVVANYEPECSEPKPLQEDTGAGQ